MKERYLVLLGLGIIPKVLPKSDYCISAPVSKGDVRALDYAALPFGITPSRFQADMSDFKEFTRPSVQIQLVADGGPSAGVIVFENSSFASSGCSQKYCCSPCSEYKQPWDLESLATMALATMDHTLEG